MPPLEYIPDTDGSLDLVQRAANQLQEIRSGENPKAANKRYNENQRIFFSQLNELLIQNPIKLAMLVKIPKVELKGTLNRLFDVVITDEAFVKWTTIRSTVDPSTIATRKTLAKSRSITREEHMSDLSFYGEGISLDKYFLEKPGGLQELNYKSKAVEEDHKAAKLWRMMREIRARPLFANEPNMISQGLPFARTIDDVYRNRRLNYNILCKSEYGFDEIFRHADATLSQNNGPGAKMCITSDNCFLNMVHRNPRLLTYDKVGAQAMDNQRMWETPKKFGGVEIMTYPKVEPAHHNTTDSTIYEHRASFGSTAVFTDDTRNGRPEDYRSFHRNVQVVDNITDTWHEYTMMDVLESMPEFGPDGEIDENVMNELIDKCDSSKDDSVWTRTRTKPSLENKREVHPFLFYDAATNKYERVRAFGEMSGYIVDDAHFMFAYETAKRALFEDMCDEELEELRSNADAFGQYKGTNQYLEKKLEKRYLECFGARPTEAPLESKEDYGDQIENPLKRRVGIMMQFDDPLLKIAASAYLTAKFSLTTFKKMIDNNIAILLMLRNSRPFEAHMMEDVWFTTGQKLGNFNTNGGDVSAMYFPVFKQFFIDFEERFGFSITHPQNIHTIFNVRASHCIGGKGYEQFRLADFLHKSPAEKLAAVLSGKCWFGNFMPYNQGVGHKNEFMRNVIPLSGVVNPVNYILEMRASDDFAGEYERPFYGGQYMFAVYGLLCGADSSRPYEREMSPNITEDEICNNMWLTGECCTTSTLKWDSMTKQLVYDEGFHVFGPQLPGMRKRESCNECLVNVSKVDAVTGHKRVKYNDDSEGY
jgi:hypothetical protein